MVAAGRANSDTGLTVIPPYRAIQCRCGPVARPLCPTAPITCPAATVSPAATRTRSAATLLLGGQNGCDARAVPVMRPRAANRFGPCALVARIARIEGLQRVEPVQVIDNERPRGRKTPEIDGKSG